jgi:hypothetical protein
MRPRMRYDHIVGQMHNARLSRGDNMDIPYSRNEAACVSGSVLTPRASPFNLDSSRLCLKYRIIGISLYLFSRNIKVGIYHTIYFLYILPESQPSQKALCV